MTTKYSAAMRSLHWLSAILILGLLAVGFYMADLPEDAANKYDLYPLHKSFGMIVLFLLFVRLPTRWRSAKPATPSGLAMWEATLSHTVHILLYVAMFSMAASGYLMNSTYEFVQGVDMFGLFTVPDITPKDEFWNGISHEIHEISAWSLVVLVGLHLAGVIKHRFIDSPENDVLGRMI